MSAWLNDWQNEWVNESWVSEWRSQWVSLMCATQLKWTTDKMSKLVQSFVNG